MQNFTYTLNLNGNLAEKLKVINVSNMQQFELWGSVSKAMGTANRSMDDLGRSMGTIKQRIEALKSQREWIPASNKEAIRACNLEMKSLNKEIVKLESLNGGFLKTKFKEAFSEIPSLFKNPVVLAGAAIGSALKNTMSFGENMSKFNVTAQLDEKGLQEAKKRIIEITRSNNADINLAPVGLEKIISQTGDAALSFDILDAAQKGARGGFTDLDTVSGALAQSLSIIGKQNASAKEVLDTFFAAKRVGAGEFADFSRYLPNLIAGANSLGISYKEVAGTFAYMTGKGMSAERSAVLMQNAYKMLGRTDFTENLKKMGVKAHDAKGQLRSLVDISSELKSALNGKNDMQKAQILEALGLQDQEARSAFSVLTADVDKLRNSMLEVADASGETEKAIKFAVNPAQSLSDVWNNLKTLGVQFGESILPAVNGAFWLFQKVLNIVIFCLGGVFELFKGIFSGFAEGEPWIYAIAGAIAFLTTTLNASAIATGFFSVATGIATIATKALVFAQNLLNITFLASPITWIIGGIILLVGGILLLWQKCEGFRKVVMGVWEVLKLFGEVIWDSVISAVKNLIDGMGSLGKAFYKLFTGDFKGAAQDAIEGTKKLVAANPIVASVNAGVKLAKADWSGAWEKAKLKGAQSWAEDNKAKEDKDKISKQNNLKDIVSDGTYDTSKLFAGGKKWKSKKENSSVLDLNSAISSLHKSGAYGAITAKLAPLALASLASSTMSSAIETSSAQTFEKQNTFLESSSYNKENEKRFVKPDKFCENVVINIAKADDKGLEQIEKIVCDVLNKVLENYG